MRLGYDVAGKFLLKEMKSFKLKCDQVFLNKAVSTPIIVEEISNGTNRNASHRWKWTCPICGSKLPAYRPIPANEIETIREQMPSCEVFYFDRVSPSAVQLAQTSRSRGAIVFFEPSMVGDKEVFKQCLRVADVVKYSHSRSAVLTKLLGEFAVPLEVETLGAEGVRYRIRTPLANSNWVAVPAYNLRNVKDSAGCGDWCSAGMIHVLGSFANGQVENVSSEVVDYALRFGQTLAALKCSFEGARGLMYAVSRESLQELVERAWCDSTLWDTFPNNHYTVPSKALRLICPNCRTSESA